MTSQSIRFFAMSLKGLTSYYNCVKNSVRILYIQFLSNLTSEICRLSLSPGRYNVHFTRTRTRRVRFTNFDLRKQGANFP
ncbi:hypothetical protein DUR03_02650 [Salmonella enterica subsp. diarizonae]|nr:hypothetical protein [Salmonella enterica subsp. diarizonae]